MSDTYTPFAPIKYDQQAVNRQGWGVANSGPDDNQLMVGFYKKSILNRAKSAEKGVPTYESRDYVKIQHPGESLNVVDREVLEQDKMRWPQRWAQYVQGVTQIPEGIPINLCFPSKPEVETTLRGYNIHTVEQLANLSAHAISTIGMGAQEWVNAAKKYMERAEKGVDHHHFETAIAKKDQQIQTMQRQIEELTRLVQQRTAPAARPDPQTYDFQEAQINRVHPSATEEDAFLQPPVQFVQDLSQSLEPSKPRGRPPGSKNRPKEQ
jgi:hypothetical protein